MRTGAIFARGSCRALKWMALVGMVFALGAGQVAAQETTRSLTGARFEIEETTPMEGATSTANTITATLSAEIPGGSTTATTVTITVGAAPLLGTDTAQRAVLESLGATPAEDGDWTIADANSSTDGTNAEFTFVFPKNELATSVSHIARDTVMLQTGNTDVDAEDEGLRLTGDTMTVSPTDPDGPTGPASEFTPTVVVGVAGSTALDPSDTIRDIKIDDKDTQTYVLTRTVPTGGPKEGDPITVTVEAKPGHVQGATRLTLRLSTPAFGYELGTITGGDDASGNMVTLGDPDLTDNTATVAGATPATNKATIPLTATADAMNDGNRVDGDLTLSAYSGVGTPAVASLPIPLMDKHSLPKIKASLVLLDDNGMPVTDGEVDDGMVTEGMEYQLTLTVIDADGEDMEAAEDLTVRLAGSGGDADPRDDYSLPTGPIMIAEGEESSDPVTLEVDLNDDLGPENLIVSATVNGEDAMYGPPQPGLNPMEVLSLTIMDATMKHVWVADGAVAAIEAAMMAAQGDDGALNVSDTISIQRSALFESAAGYSVRLDIESSDLTVAGADDVTDWTDFRGDVLQIWPRAPGTATITITGTAVGPSGVVTPVPQTQVDVAQITVEVMVELAVPGIPQILPPDERDGHVVLSWNPPAGGGEPASYEYDQDASDQWTSTGTARTATVTGLTNGEKYIFRVRARNASGAGKAARVEATPVAAPLGPQVTVKEVKAATSVNESGGLDVTVVATVPPGTKGADGKYSEIPMRRVDISFTMDHESITAGEDDAEQSELTVLDRNNGQWKDIQQAEKESTANYTFRVAVGQDLDAEDEKFQIEVRIDGEAKKSDVITINDAEDQEYALSLPAAAKGAITEGAEAVDLTLKAVPEKTFDIPYTLTLEVEPGDSSSNYTLGGSTSGSFGTDSAEATIAAKSDGAREDRTITVTAYTAGGAAKLTSLDIDVKDANALPMVKAMVVDKDGKAVETMSVAEGETVKIMLTVVDKDGKAAKADENLSISLEPTGAADAQDYRLSAHPIEIAKDKESSAAVDLMITEDDDLGEEDLTFNAVVSGDPKVGPGEKTSMGVLSLMITDGTQKLVYAKTQEEVEAAIYAAKNAGAGDDMTFTSGEMIEVMGNALFSSAEGVTLSFTAESDMSDVASASVSGGTVMVTAESEGMAHITITAHASMASGVKILDQTDPGMASVVFPVEVGLEALSIMLTGPEDMNVAEGGMGAMVTATANRAATDDVTVMLMRDRSMSSAADADFTAEPIVIEAGEMMGSTMVMAVEDSMMEDMEELVLYGMTEGMAGEVTGEVKLYLWDAAVPALPVIAQLLLAAFLAVGGYRRYRRR